MEPAGLVAPGQQAASVAAGTAVRRAAYPAPGRGTGSQFTGAEMETEDRDEIGKIEG